MEFKLDAISVAEIVMGSVAGITIAITYIPRFLNARSKAKNSDVQANDVTTSTITAGRRDVSTVHTDTADIGILFNNTGSIATNREVQAAFNGFFFGFIGDKIGILNHKPNLDPKNSKAFASHYQLQGEQAFKVAKDKLASEIREYASKLANTHVETRLDDLVQRLLKIQDPFEITDELEKSISQEVDSILGTIEL